MSANKLINELSLKDTGFSEGVKKAQEALKQLAKENGVTNVSFKNQNKEINSAKKYYSQLTDAYSKLSDEAKRSDFGMQMKKQIEMTEQSLKDLFVQTAKTEKKLAEMREEARRAVNGSEGKMDFNKMSSDFLNKAGLGNVASAMEGVGNMLGGGLAKGAVGVAAAGYAVKEFVDVSKEAIQKSAEFGKSISELGAITGQSGKALQDMRQKVMSVGKDTNTAFTDVSKNFALIGSALPELLKDSRGMEEVSRNAITLSKAGLMPLEDATDSLTSTMAQFDIKANQSANVIDILANGAKLGSAGIKDIADAVQRSGVAASTSNVSLAETTSLIEVLASKGIKGAEAGTQLRNVLLALSTKATDDLNPKLVGISTALENLQKHTDDAQYMVKLFGAESSGAATILANNIPMFKDLSTQIEKVGTASSMAVDNTNNLESAWQRTKVQWNNLLSSFGVDNANGPLMIVASEISNIITAVDGLVTQFKESESMQSSMEAWGANFEMIGEAISSVINICTDLIGTLSEIVDAGGNVVTINKVIATVFKAVEDVVLMVEMAVWGLTKAIREVINWWKSATKEMTKGISKIPFLEKIKSYLDSIIKTIKSTLKAWSEFKAYFKAMMKDDRLGNVNNNTTSNTNQKSDSKATKEDPKVKQQKGIIKQLEEDLEDLKNKREKATSKAEIDKLNKQITAKQKELDRLENKKSSSSKTLTAEQKYNGQLALIEEKLLQRLITEKEATESKIKAIESYISELGKTKESLKKNRKLIGQLSEQERQLKETLKVQTIQQTDKDSIKKANEEYRLTIDRINRNREEGWLTEDEYNREYVNALQKLIDTYKNVNAITQEWSKTVNKKEGELKSFKFDLDFKKAQRDFELLEKQVIEDVEDILNGHNTANELYKNQRSAFDKIFQKEDKYYQDILSYLKSLGITKKTLDDVLNGRGNTSIEDLSKVVSSMISFDEKFLTDYKKLLEENKDLIGDYGKNFKSFFDILVNASNRIGVREDYNNKKANGWRGDKSNWSLNQTPSTDLIRRESNYFGSVGRTDNFLNTKQTEELNKQLDELLEKYQKIEAEYQKLNEESIRKGIEPPIQTAQELDYLEDEIDSLHDKLQDRLIFEVKVNGARDALTSLGSMTDYMYDLTELGDRFQQINLNPDTSDFQKSLQKLSLIIQTVVGGMETFNTAMTFYNALQDLSIGKSVAKASALEAEGIAQSQATATESANVVASTANAVANKALTASYLDLAAAEIYAAHSAIPFAGVGIATGLAEGMLASMAAIKAQTASLSAFANGGIVGGNSWHGDNQLIRVNSGEMILNKNQQSNLFRLLDGHVSSNGKQEVEFKLRGTDLIGLINNTTSKKSRIR